MLQNDAVPTAQVPMCTVKAPLHRAQARLWREVVHVLNQMQEPTTDVAEEVSNDRGDG